MIFRKIHHFTSCMLGMFIFLADSAHELLLWGVALKVRAVILCVLFDLLPSFDLH